MANTAPNSPSAQVERYDATDRVYSFAQCVRTESYDETTSRDAMVSTSATIVATTSEIVLPMDHLSAAKPPPSNGLINFGIVVPGLYRSGYPQAQDYPFVQTLKLKTIVTLVSKEMPDGYQDFIDANGITHKVFDMAGTKKQVISTDMMLEILDVVTDSANHPLLIHCNHGKHRTGCVVGLVRKASQWDVPAVLQEYTRYASPKVRETDLDYLTKFSHMHLKSARRKLALRSTAASARINTLTKPSPPPFTLGSFLFFVMVASVALCLFIFTGRTFARAPPAPSRRRGATE
ncbi:tyrosine-protein phosphatase SIW14 [Microdochium nivale]|nr:tyrosine-protein phosphatase SIW14 [Microdochium nivale]